MIPQDNLREIITLSIANRSITLILRSLYRLSISCKYIFSFITSDRHLWKRIYALIDLELDASFDIKTARKYLKAPFKIASTPHKWIWKNYRMIDANTIASDNGKELRMPSYLLFVSEHGHYMFCAQYDNSKLYLLDEAEESFKEISIVGHNPLAQYRLFGVNETAIGCVMLFIFIKLTIIKYIVYSIQFHDRHTISFNLFWCNDYHPDVTYNGIFLNAISDRVIETHKFIPFKEGRECTSPRGLYALDSGIENIHVLHNNEHTVFIYHGSRLIFSKVFLKSPKIYQGRFILIDSDIYDVFTGHHLFCIPENKDHEVRVLREKHAYIAYYFIDHI